MSERSIDVLLNHYTLRHAALWYAYKDWPIFPLHVKGKEPITPHGLKDATTEIKIASAWWEIQPEANIGLNCGMAKLVVIDVDNKYEGVKSWTALNPGIKTAMASSGGGGWHLFYKLPSGLEIHNSASKLALGIDVRGDGGYVVMPPSLHPSGLKYRWVEMCEPAVLPDRLIELLAEKPKNTRVAATRVVSLRTTPYGKAALNAEINIIRFSLEGQRNNNLNRAAYNLGQLIAGGELDRTEAESALYYAASEVGLSDSEIAKTVTGAIGSGMNFPRRNER